MADLADDVTEQVFGSIAPNTRPETRIDFHILMARVGGVCHHALVAVTDVVVAELARMVNLPQVPL